MRARVTCAWIVFGQHTIPQVWIKVPIVLTLPVEDSAFLRALVVGAAVGRVRVELVLTRWRASVRTHEVLSCDTCGGHDAAGSRGVVSRFCA